MGKFDGILICSDFDGTLAHKAQISDANRDALRYFQSEGGMFVPVSGRSYSYFDQHEISFVSSKYIVGLNGAQIYDCEFKKLVYQNALDRAESIKLTYEILSEFNEIKFAYVHDSEDRCRVDLETWDKISIPDGDIYKMVFVVDAEDSDRAFDEIANFVPEQYTAVRSWINGIEVLGCDNTKGTAVKRLRGLLGERARKTVAVGDYENDISMLREADIGYAVKGSSLKVREAADRMTVGVQDDAIAYVVEDIENELRTAPGSFWREVISQK